MRIAAFDFGSHAIKCLIAELLPSGIRLLANQRAQNRLASYLEDGCLRPEATAITLGLLSPLLQLCRDLEVQTYLAVGTEALRQAANRDAFSAAIRQATGLDLRILGPDAEAALAWKGVISGITDMAGELCLFDSGGASTEFIWGNEAEIKASHSFPLGAVALHKEFIHSDPVQMAELHLLEKAISQRLIYPWPATSQLMGIGGGVLACAKVALGSEPNDLSTLDGFQLTRNELERQIELYSSSNLEQRRHIPGMEPGRVDIILPAAILFRSILSSLNLISFRISTRDLRYGLIQQELANASLHSIR